MFYRSKIGITGLPCTLNMLLLDQLGTLGRVGLVVTKSVCVFVSGMSPSHAIFFRPLIGPVITTIRIGRESWCLPYAGFLLVIITIRMAGATIDNRQFHFLPAASDFKRKLAGQSVGKICRKKLAGKELCQLVSILNSGTFHGGKIRGKFQLPLRTALATPDLVNKKKCFFFLFGILFFCYCQQFHVHVRHKNKRHNNLK